MTSVLFRISIVLASVFALSQAYAKPPSVLASIKPIQLIVAAVMDGVAQPDLLIRGSADPHSYSLRISDQKKINNADLIVWFGTDLERVLENTVDHDSDRVFTISDELQAQLLSFRQAKDQANDQYVEDQKPESDQHSHAGLDPHFWLSITHTNLLVQALATRLSVLDPEHANQYEANSDQFVRRTSQLRDAIRQDLSERSSKRTAVFHDAYQYFEQDVGQPVTTVLELGHSRSVSLKRLRTISKDPSITCLLIDQKDPGVGLVEIANSVGLVSSTVDLMGIDSETYELLIQSFAIKLLSCGKPQ